MITEGSQGKSSRKELKQTTEELVAGCFTVAYPVCFLISTQDLLPTGGWALTHQSLTKTTKRMYHRLAHQPV